MHLIFAEWHASHEVRSFGGMMQALVYIVVIFKASADTLRPRHEFEERERSSGREGKGSKISLSLEWKEALILFHSGCTPSGKR